MLQYFRTSYIGDILFMDNIDPSPSTDQHLIAKSGTFLLGGQFPIYRLGLGTMRLTGPGIWGEPTNRNEAINVLRQAISLGINFLDTADSYGPKVAEELIAEALYPYPDNLLIATKAGFLRPGPNEWVINSSPEHLRSACEDSLRKLKLERIDLFQLHRIDPKVSLEDQIGTLLDLQHEGKIRHIGLSEVTVDQIETVRRMTPIVSVQNEYNLVKRQHEDVLNYCTQENIGFIPWFPLATGELAKSGSVLSQIAQQYNTSPAQIAIAWLLKKSPVMLPIPGTSSVKHLKENLSAVNLELDSKIMGQLENITTAN